MRAEDFTAPVAAKARANCMRNVDITRTGAL